MSDNPLRDIEVEEALKESQSYLETSIKLQPLAAKSLRNYYSELRKQGFTKQEALDLIQYHGCLPPSPIGWFESSKD